MVLSSDHAYRRVWEYYLESLWGHPGVVEVHLDQNIIRIWVHPTVIDTITVPSVLIHQGVAVKTAVHAWQFPESKN